MQDNIQEPSSRERQVIVAKNRRKVWNPLGVSNNKKYEAPNAS